MKRVFFFSIMPAISKLKIKMMPFLVVFSRFRINFYERFFFFFGYIFTYFTLFIFFYFFLNSFNLWRSLLMIALYHQIKIPISFLCRRGLNPISLIQPSEILLIKLTETHILLPLLIIRVLYIYSSPKLYTLFQVLTKKPLANTIRFTYYLSLSTIPINYYVTFLSFLEFNSWTLKIKN